MPLAWSLCGCAARRMAPRRPNRVTVVRGLPRPPRRLVLWLSSAPLDGERRSTTAPRRLQLGGPLGSRGIRYRVPDRSTGSAPARSGSEPSLRSTCPSPPSLPRRASEVEMWTTSGSGAPRALRRKGVAPGRRVRQPNRLVCHTYDYWSSLHELASLLNSPTSCSSSTTLSFSLARIDNRTPWLVGTQPEHSACSAALSCK